MKNASAKSAVIFSPSALICSERKYDLRLGAGATSESKQGPLQFSERSNYRLVCAAPSCADGDLKAHQEFEKTKKNQDRVYVAVPAKMAGCGRAVSKHVM